MKKYSIIFAGVLLTAGLLNAGTQDQQSEAVEQRALDVLRQLHYADEKSKPRSYIIFGPSCKGPMSDIDWCKQQLYKNPRIQAWCNDQKNRGQVRRALLGVSAESLSPDYKLDPTKRSVQFCRENRIDISWLVAQPQSR